MSAAAVVIGPFRVHLFPTIHDNCHLLSHLLTITYRVHGTLGTVPHPSNIFTGPLTAVRSKSDCRSRGCEFNRGPVPFFQGD